MNRRAARIPVVLLVLTSALAGCGGSTAKPAVLVQPGNFAPPSQPTPRLKTALPDVAVGNVVGAAPDLDLMTAASDELLALLQSSDRFDLTEHQRLHELLAEQHLTDMIQPGRLVHPGSIRGVDLLFLARLTDLSIKKQAGPQTVSVSGLMQATGIEKVTPRLTIDADVSLDLVDARTGAINVTSSRKVHFIATPQELGLKLTADQLTQASEVRLSPQDTRTVLRFVLNEPLRPMLPPIDRLAASPPAPIVSPATPTASLPPPAASLPSPTASLPLPTTSFPSPAAPSIAVTPPTAAPQAQPATRQNMEKTALLLICPDCGYRLTGDEEFCPNCHRKLK